MLSARQGSHFGKLKYKKNYRLVLLSRVKISLQVVNKNKSLYASVFYKRCRYTRSIHQSSTVYARLESRLIEWQGRQANIFYLYTEIILVITMLYVWKLQIIFEVFTHVV